MICVGFELNKIVFIIDENWWVGIVLNMEVFIG